VVADHGDADLGEGVDRRLVVLDLLVAALEPELDLLGGHRMAFDAGDDEPSGLELRLDPPERLDATGARHVAQGAAHAGDGVANAALTRQAQPSVLAGSEQLRQLHADAASASSTSTIALIMSGRRRRAANPRGTSDNGILSVIQ